MFDIWRYSNERKEEWNAFVARSKNGTFLLNRDYMDYHSERFCDHSLMFYLKGELYALLPANVKDSVLVSHGGLTYGGLIMGENTTCANVVVLFEELNSYLRANGIAGVCYKLIPHIYHRQPSEEDLYAIFRNCNARLACRGISSTIYQEQRIKWSHGRKYSVSKARNRGVKVERSDDYDAFWRILEDNLAHKYGLKPAHTVEEIKLLQSRFPENICLYTALSSDDEVIGGTVLYITPQVVHSQYISASPEGKRLGAVDAVLNRILNEDFKDCRCFDFGISTENGGAYLNEALIYQKEGFGGRGICYDVYEWETQNS